MPLLYVLDEPGEQALHRGLVGAQGDALVQHVADGDHVAGGAIDADDRNDAALLHGVDRPMEGDGRASLELELLTEKAVQETSRGIRPNRVDADVGAEG